jgi:hypothetical protein
VCYLQDQRDDRFSIGARAESAGVDFVPVEERHSFDPAVWPALLRIVRDRRIDVVHAHDYKTDLLALALARRTGIVPLATVHNWCGRSLRERLFYYPADKRLMRFFPLVIAVSTPIRNELLRLGVPPSRIRMLVNGVDVAAFTRDPEVVAEARATAGASAGDWLIGAVGRLEAEKRYDLLIEAAAELRERGRAVRVAIVGEGSERPRLEALAAERGFGRATTSSCSPRTTRGRRMRCSKRWRSKCRSSPPTSAARRISLPMDSTRVSCRRATFSHLPTSSSRRWSIVTPPPCVCATRASASRGRSRLPRGTGRSNASTRSSSLMAPAPRGGWRSYEAR